MKKVLALMFVTIAIAALAVSAIAASYNTQTVSWGDGFNASP